MDEIQATIGKLFLKGAYRFVLSCPRNREQPLERLEMDACADGFQLTWYKGQQAFHENHAAAEAQAFLAEALAARYSQLHAWSDAREFCLRVTQRGKLLVSGKAAGPDAPKRRQSHDIEKNYLIAPGDRVPPLVDMGVMTPSGQVVHAMRRKFRQINRFLEIIDDEIREDDPKMPLSIMDFGCGKSYLTFVLYHYLTAVRGRTVTMVGLDLKRDLIDRCNQVAEKYGYTGLSFRVGDIGAYQPDRPMDMVITLHACDTATDYALFHAVQSGARMIFSVPCCQHELNRQIQTDSLALLTRYGIVKERIAALMTDAIRGNLLEYCGYRTQLLEFIDLEHTPKNILIRAIKTQEGKRIRPLDEAKAAMEAFHLRPTLYRLLVDESDSPRNNER